MSDVSTSEDTPQSILKKYWGYDNFRPLQRDIVDSILGQNDTIALLPTGGGKSICYQVPAMLKEGVCVVISPLISLMEDQVNTLRDKDIKAIAINSYMSSRDIDRTLDNAVYGKTKLLYISPERIHTEIFQERFKKMNVSFVAVDEAHCISQWGHEFRPAYLEIHTLKELKPELKFLALTATATAKVVDDIKTYLHLEKSAVFSQSFERENIAFKVARTDNKSEHLLRTVKAHDGSGIIYARNRKKCRELSEYLNFKGIPASYYHAGIGHEERMKRQLHWTNSKNEVMVATNAFGMGIDKSNVRYVIHWDLPDSPEAFYQEAGRAGRDQKEALSLVLYGENDIKKLRTTYYSSYPKLEEIRQVYQGLCNYFQVAVGDMPEDPLLFNLGIFCEKTGFTKSMSWNALRILQNESYISLSESFYQPSQIHINGSKQDLQAFEREHRNYEELLKFLLRAYSGILDQPVPVEETDIISKTKLSAEKLKQYLTYMEKVNLLKYLPRTSTPAVTFMKHRVKTDKVVLSSGFKQRKDAHFIRIETMIDYVQNTGKCRASNILAYFGETDKAPCGKCDVCLSSETKLTNEVFRKIAEKIKETLESQGDIDKDALTAFLPEYPEAMILEVCRQLIAEDVIRVNSQMKFSAGK